MAIPWKTLTGAGLRTDRLIIDLASRGLLRRPPRLGRGFENLKAVPDSAATPRRLTVRLHFAERAGIKPGQRVFDVKLGDKVVLEDFDVVKAAGGPDRAVVKTFDDVATARALSIEFTPKASAPPILSGIEILTRSP